MHTPDVHRGLHESIVPSTCSCPMARLPSAVVHLLAEYVLKVGIDKAMREVGFMDEIASYYETAHGYQLPLCECMLRQPHLYARHRRHRSYPMDARRHVCGAATYTPRTLYKAVKTYGGAAVGQAMLQLHVELADVQREQRVDKAAELVPPCSEAAPFADDEVAGVMEIEQ